MAGPPALPAGQQRARTWMVHRYSIAEFREDIRLGKEVIEAGSETPIPPCPWQTSHCEKVLELITSDRRCQDCPLRWRLLGVSEDLTTPNGSLRLEVRYDRDLSG